MAKQKNIDENIVSALKEAQWLISEEYQAVVDEDLRQKYDEVLKKLGNVLERIGRN